MPSFRTCPECSERLDPDARRCACGWSGERKPGQGPAWNHVCRWRYGALTCENPVGQFAHGETSGLCIFHRATDRGPQAAEIAQDSRIHDQDSYNAAAARQTYGNGDNPMVARLRAQIEAKPNRRRCGSFGNLDEWIELCRQRAGHKEAA